MSTMLVATKGADPATKSTIKDLSNMIDSVVENNFDVRKEVSLLVKYMDVNDCKNTVFFEISKRARRLWIATPSVTLKFGILSHQSVFDLSTINNYHKNAGHVILFTKDFEENEKLKIAKTALETAFKCKEDVQKERALCFFYLNGVVSIRNYLIKGVSEIGPRIDLELDRIFEGCFKGKRIDESSQ
ncbi:uncharacterized protein VICG_00303 [Vittaforma corneae ATCC 50505]|uniref:Brix domain-containing protein n=1 Tax=Vittaforma corneae (strain ATCC 50505) TaxID=993615 RepID=L2GNY8_VITCO|nr:uncharacterized protein VICG_00303 [Vittaforma corneae ATCC 50505]ELA42551.1 hypothetical protein VICG_00303 [Vittaforma corneae ATCC 50505]